MTIQDITNLVGVLAWPVVVLVILALLRVELVTLVARVRQIEGPGDLKVSLDPNKVQRIIEPGQKENSPPAAVAERIVQSAIFGKLETRILRALVDDDGRAIYSYQTDYYRPSLESLIAKGFVRKVDKGFALTQEGRRVTKEYLVGVLQSFDPPHRQEGAVENS